MEIYIFHNLEFEKWTQSLYNSMVNHSGSNSEVDRSLCEVLLQILTDSLGMINKTPHDAFSLHEAAVKLSANQVKQSLEQLWSQSRSTSTSKKRITYEEFQNLAFSVYLKTMSASFINNDENDVPFDDGEYEYGDDDADEMNNAQVPLYDDDDEEEDEDSENEEQTIQNNSAQQNKSRGSYTDEMNLIDYVIEEEKEIGGAKGEDSESTSRSTTYSSLLGNEQDSEEMILSNETRTNPKSKISTKEEGQIIRARAFLNRLDTKIQEKDELVKQIRESVYLTKDQTTKMEQNKIRLEKDLDQAQDQQNPTTINRLTGELNRLVREIALERDVLIEFQSKLDAAEMDRTKTIIERARYNAEEAVLKEKESQLIEQKRSLAQLRQRQEDWKVTQMKRVHLSELHTQKQALEQQAAAQRSAMDEARRSKKIAHKYLQQTFEKIRTEKRNEEEASRADTEKKIKSLLNLRNAIERNKDTLSIQTAQKRAQERDVRDAQKREQRSIEEEGQNGLFYMLRKQKNEKLEEMQKRFAEQQDANRLAIVDKILKEENEKERKRRLYPELYKSTTNKPLTMSTSTITRPKDLAPISQ
ncbi:unnamed protein product [Rotaria magnacalcarata]|uniref:Uncharacterized protein n=4 Tax=Rotaria magnacalcarata TaxID=392030 RepID=A0A816NKL9_9BILA|nr:unnamed protein product [Rotaria magnacalcarata]